MPQPGDRHCISSFQGFRSTKNSMKLSCASHSQAKLGSPSTKQPHGSGIINKIFQILRAHFVLPDKHITFEKKKKIHLGETISLCIFLQKNINNEAGFCLYFTSNLLNNHFFLTDKSYIENSSFPLSLPKNVTDFFSLMFLMRMF